MKFSIITPAYNMEQWIAETIETVLSQKGDFEVEYIVVDDGSHDRTADIAREYERKVRSYVYPIQCNHVTMEVVSQVNTGMYEAINRGFARATGDVYAWINADDTYELGAFGTIARTLRTFTEIDWIKGITATIDERGAKTRAGRCKLYAQQWIQKGIYGQEAYFIEQDSVFWKASIWKQAGPMPAHMRSAADYWLWLQFAKYAPLWSLNTPVSNFRKRDGQISKGIAKYKEEQREVRSKRDLTAWRARLFFTPQSRMLQYVPQLEPIFRRLYFLFFPEHRTAEYIEIENDSAVKKRFLSYVV